MSDDDLPEFYIEAAQVVVGMHPFPSAAETGIAIEAVRRTILHARSQAFDESAKLIEEGFDKEVAKPYRSDGVPSKNDECPHGKYMYEDCESCCSQAIRQHSQKGKSE